MTALQPVPAATPPGTPAPGSPDPFDVRLAHHAPGILGDFNRAGVLAPADVHVARCLADLAGRGTPDPRAGEAAAGHPRAGAPGPGHPRGDADEAVLLGAALAVRAPRLGHVCADLATARISVTADAAVPIDLQALPWPEPAEWVERLAASPLVAVGDSGADDRPLRLEGTRLYLDRYWRQERRVAADLLGRGAEGAAGIDFDVLAAGLTRLFPPAGNDAPDLQRLAAATAVLRRLAVVAGGPGTGKTTTVARILCLLDEQALAAGRRPLRVALAAPTGKAAARLEEAVHSAAARLEMGDATRGRLLDLEGSTLHRLLGWRPSGHPRFRHHGGNRLPHEVVVVDETSMVSLSMLASLVDAVGSGARLVLVGDPGQLASVEAGAVLGDVVGPAAAGLRMRPPSRTTLAAVTGQEVPATDPPPGVAIGDGIVVLRTVHRYGGALAALAEAVHAADPDAVVAVLGAGADDVRWIDVDLAAPGVPALLAPVRDAVVDAGRLLRDAAVAGDARAALDGLGAMRVLCAHRRGPYGVATWTATAERWLVDAVDGYGAGGRWYPGQPLLVTENDYSLRLFNGDTGVVVAGAERPTAVFERRGQLVAVSPSRLQAVETVHAMTVHKSQGSQFDAVAVLLPDPSSAILTRELLYTAVTRARTRLTVAGPEASIRAAVARPIARASGLAGRLWST